jgi:hypothetical protein
VFEFRWANRVEQLPEFAADLVRSKVVGSVLAALNVEIGRM